MQLTRRLTALTLTSALVLGATCDDDDGPTSPTVAQVAGNYSMVGNTLVGDETFDGVGVQVVLTNQ